MEDFWARFIEPTGQPGLNYWEYFAERLVQLANIHDRSTILDLGTFDGNVLSKAMKKMNAFGYGIGADIYYGGFKDGVEYVKDHDLEEHIAFVQADGNALGFCPDLFDTVLANFIGWDDYFDFECMKFKSPDRMMSEIMRVLRPGGQVGIGAWLEQNDIDWFIEAFRKYLPEYDKNITCYARENPEGQGIILRSGGFNDIRVHWEIVNFVSSDEETWWRQMRCAVSEYFNALSDLNIVESFKEKIFDDLQLFRCPEGIQFSKKVSFAFGTKPL